MVKLKVTETAQRAALEGMQMMGGYGYSSEYDMERLVRQTWSALAEAAMERAPMSLTIRPFEICAAMVEI